LRAVLDTNILISALIVRSSPPAYVLYAWLAKRFTLVSSEAQLGELRRVSRYGHIRPLLKPCLTGELVNRIRDRGVLVESLPKLDLSPDPDDNLILGTVLAASADYLVTGDRSDLLTLKKVENVSIVSSRGFLARF
jgi:putative PIN family toxin of toxin-antitoxin system